MSTSSFGSLVRVYRVARCQTQTQLGDAVGVTAMAISSIENGTERGSLELRTRIAEKLGIPRAYVQQGDERHSD